MAKRSTEVTVKLPWADGKWVVDERQRAAAWEIYVELVTRIAIEPLGKDEGLLREALSSLYSLFGETRRILRAAGPGVAIPERKKFLSLGQIAVDGLNVALRPVLAKWHPLLMQHEAVPHAGLSQVEHERAWQRADELRGLLDGLRATLVNYADILAQACGIPSLHKHAQAG